MRSWDRYEVLRKCKFVKHHMTRKRLVNNFRRDVNKTIFPFCPESPVIIFDIGANMGIYTSWLAKHYEKTATVYAFEPVKLNFDYLLKNLEKNRVSNVRAYNIGFFSKNTRMELGMPFNKDSRKTGLYTYKGPRDNVIKRKDLVTCTFKKLNEFILDNNIEKIDIVKMDVEGAQYDILSSSIDILDRIQYLHIELGEAVYNEEDKKTLSLLFKNNFEILMTRKQNWLFVNKNVK